MISDEIASALSPFFDGIGPSHDEITVLFRRAGLDHFDPLRDAGGRPIGKMKRVRGVLYEAARNDPKLAGQLALSLVDAARRCGGFRPQSPNYAGEQAVEALRAAYGREGMDVDDEGVVRPINLESLDGRELTEALRLYVQRARKGGWDPVLVLGTAKRLEEAAARHALKQTTGSYPTRANVPTPMYQAFTSLGLAVPDHSLLKSMSPDPREALQLQPGFECESTTDLQ